MGKKLILLLTAVLLPVLLSACGAEKAGGNDRESKSSITERGQSTTESVAFSRSESEILDTERLPAVSVPELKPAESLESSINSEREWEEAVMKITANGISFSVEFVENSSAKAFRELLEQGPVTVEMQDYGNFEKVGPLGTSLPTNDEPITTEPGDVILYQGSSITVYYDTNHWNFTRLGKIPNVTREELLEAFGSGSVTMTFTLE